MAHVQIAIDTMMGKEKAAVINYQVLFVQIDRDREREK
jgi:hypothetical protein